MEYFLSSALDDLWSMEGMTSLCISRFVIEIHLYLVGISLYQNVYKRKLFVIKFHGELDSSVNRVQGV